MVVLSSLPSSWFSFWSQMINGKIDVSCLKTARRLSRQNCFQIKSAGIHHHFSTLLFKSVINYSQNFVYLAILVAEWVNVSTLCWTWVWETLRIKWENGGGMSSPVAKCPHLKGLCLPGRLKEITIKKYFQNTVIFFKRTCDVVDVDCCTLGNHIKPNSVCFLLNTRL